MRCLVFLCTVAVAAPVILCRKLEPENVAACVEQYRPVVLSVAAEMTRVLSINPDMAALQVRLAWHSAGTFNKEMRPVGGCHGGCIRMTPEYNDGANAVIDDALAVVARLLRNHSFVSFADMVQLVAAVTTELTGNFSSVQMYFTPGRLDYHDFTASKRCAPNRLPSKELPGDKFPLPKTQIFVLEKFGLYLTSMTTSADAQGLYDTLFVERAVALMGGHALGGMHLGTSGNEGTFTTNPHVFDNQYYVNLVELEWGGAEMGGSRANGSTRTDLQYWRRGVTLLPTDVAVAQHPQMIMAARKFAGNNTAFLEAYALVFEELGENGVDRGDMTCVVPGTTGNSAQAGPSPGGGTGCTASDLVHTTTTTYACMRALPVPGLTLHWTNTDSLLSVALLNDAPTGWFAMSFPTVRGAMLPAPYALVFAADTLQLMSISSRSLAGFTPQPVSAGIAGATHEKLNGKQVIRFNFANGSAFNPAQVFINVARDDSATLQIHSARNRASLQMDFVLGVGTSVELDGPLYWRKVHGYLMGLATLFVIPLGIFFKRYGKKLFGLSGSTVWPFGIAFIAHIGCMIIGTILIFAAMLIAVTKLRSVRVEEDVHSHRALGMACVVLVFVVCSLGAIGRMFPAAKTVQRLTHSVLGIAMLIMMFTQIVTGYRKIREYHPDLDVSLLLPFITTGFSFIVVTCLLLEFALRRTAERTVPLRTGNVVAPTDALDEDRNYFSLQQVSAHDNEVSAWVILEGKVYDVTVWLDSHPGGRAILLDNAGSDATDQFYLVRHSSAALKRLREYYVGDVEGEEVSSCIEMVEKIAACMVELDTEGAERLLRSPPEDLPQSLSLGLTELVLNLGEYKPYLPEHLIGSFDGSYCAPILRNHAFDASPPARAVMVFTDIQASTVLWESCNSGMKKALEMHNAAIREAIDDLKGYEVKTIGDAFMVAFSTSPSAVQFGLKVQESLSLQEWPLTLLDQPLCAEVRSKTDGAPIWAGLRVRIGIHVGEVDAQKNPLTGRLDFFGNTVNKAARVEAKSVGGALCVTEEVLSEITSQEMMKTMCLIPMGSVTLKGVKEKAKLTLVLPECLEARKTEVISSFMKAVAPDNTGRKKELVRTSSLMSSSGLSERGDKQSKVALNRDAAGTVVAMLFAGDTGNPFLEASRCISTILDSLIRTKGALLSVCGSVSIATWNLLKPSSEHVTQAARHVTRVGTRESFDYTEGPDSMDVDPALSFGVCTGICSVGSAGTHTQKLYVVVGPPIDLVLKLAHYTQDLGCPALTCILTGHPGVAEDQAVASCCRPVDVWGSNVTSLRWIVIYELQTLMLKSRETTHGFTGSKKDTRMMWGTTIADAIGALNELEESSLDVKEQRDVPAHLADVARVYTEALAATRCSCGRLISFTCASCHIQRCSDCTIGYKASMHTQVECTDHHLERDISLGSVTALKHMAELFGPKWLAGETPSVPTHIKTNPAMLRLTNNLGLSGSHEHAMLSPNKKHVRKWSHSSSNNAKPFH